MPTNNAINLSQLGIVAYNGTGTFFGRTLTSTGNTVTITNPNGVSAAPNFEVNTANININNLGGVPLAVENGGTGNTTLTENGLLLGNGTNPTTSVPAGTNGQLLIGATGEAPAFTTLTLLGGLTQTPGANSLTLTAPPITITGNGVTVTGSPVSLGGTVTLTVSAGAGLTWVNVSETKKTIAPNIGYIANNVAQVVFTLPDTANIGDMFYITGNGHAGTAGWQIKQNDSQQIYFGSKSTTAGLVGSLTATSQLDSICAVCVVAGTSTIWNIITSVGNIMVV
ncbi:hypothetical protein RHABOEDO_001879 (plasmid) [Candidatus Rhabdochlamydia oedothoracis]|uniref:Uncharacterized protein n=1 Tax=Candidatus Rhabdochlamydia oedothoracis TaxID=2720720 RepID=A0ABX8V2K3_9BACT|nr:MULTISPECIES: hypothetical protein [Rhabdochlamydia]KAG6559872.1 hypothetical protein RHOW815_000055 [Candidatus Rhabdochlamydia sp. W815]QYF49483.1 hypothetical protein RHABOEDO_001879 [Candidatus Rhabdochlamydia oedothoracis]